MPMRHSFVIICLLFLAGHVVFGQTTKARNWCLIGVAKVDVTPKGPVVLAGYGGRTTEHEGIDTKLWARANPASQGGEMDFLKYFGFALLPKKFRGG